MIIYHLPPLIDNLINYINQKPNMKASAAPSLCQLSKVYANSCTQKKTKTTVNLKFGQVTTPHQHGDGVPSDSLTTDVTKNAKVKKLFLVCVNYLIEIKCQLITHTKNIALPKVATHHKPENKVARECFATAGVYSKVLE